jgi:hypothetical protein
MNMSRFVLAVVAAYVVMAILGMGTDMVMMPYYDSFNALARPEAEMSKLMPMMLVAYLLQTILFCYIYVVGRKAGGLMEGVRYGLVIGLFMGLSNVVLSAVLPWSLETVVASVIATLIVYVGGGIAAALVYKPAALQSA